MEIIDGRDNKEKIEKIISDIQESNSLKHLTHYDGSGNFTNIPWFFFTVTVNWY